VADRLFVKEKVRLYVKDQGLNTSGNVWGEKDSDSPLDNVIKEILDKAINRAKLDKRKTLKARDL